jgi:hypothetical protein
VAQGTSDPSPSRELVRVHCLDYPVCIEFVQAGGLKLASDIPLDWRGSMSQERQAQWTHRLEHLHALRARFTAAHHYDRAYEAYLIIQHVYDRWADEMFCSHR